jgi:hypothetical protein
MNFFSDQNRIPETPLVNGLAPQSPFWSLQSSVMSAVKPGLDRLARPRQPAAVRPLSHGPLAL